MLTLQQAATVDERRLYAQPIIIIFVRIFGKIFVHEAFGGPSISMPTLGYSGNGMNVLRITVITLWQHRFIVSISGEYRNIPLKIRWNTAHKRTHTQNVSQCQIFGCMAFIMTNWKSSDILCTIIRAERDTCNVYTIYMFVSFKCACIFQARVDISFTTYKQNNTMSSVSCIRWLRSNRMSYAFSCFRTIKYDHIYVYIL